jgi:phosphoribosylanthranilate isomerase
VSRVAVKICGITSPEDARAAAAAGADAIGLVFWPGSPRALDVEAARRVADAVPPLVLRVGVFVDAPASEIDRVAAVVGLDVVQLHGSEMPEACRLPGRRVLKALRVGEAFDPEQALRYEGRAAGLLLDAAVGALPGGSGRSFDWSQAAALRPRVGFLMLAGGLTAANVGDAIARVRPDAVDVSSGVEVAPGRKDREKMRAFVAAVRAAEARLDTGAPLGAAVGRGLAGLAR